MYKISIFLALFSFYGFSQTIHFKEEKHINALQTSVYKNGVLDINKERIKIEYLKEGKSLTFNNEQIIEKTTNQTKILNPQEHLELTLFFKIIRAIFTDNPHDLEAYFKIESNKDTTILRPTEYIANVIEKMEYQKKGTSLKFLKIYFINEDWIRIEEIN